MSDSRGRTGMKRGFGLLVSCALLVPLAPVLAVIALPTASIEGSNQAGYQVNR